MEFMDEREFVGQCPGRGCQFIFFENERTEEEFIESSVPKHLSLADSKVCSGSGKTVKLKDNASQEEKERRDKEKKEELKQQALKRKTEKKNAKEALRLTIVCPIKGAFLWEERDFTFISSGWDSEGLRQRSLDEWFDLFDRLDLDFGKTLIQIVKEEFGEEFTVTEQLGEPWGMFGDNQSDLFVLTKETEKT